MKLSKLINSLDIIEVIGKTDVDIVEIKTESNKITKGCLFVCLNGTTHNGHDYIKQAEVYGAVAIITESKQDCNVTQIIVKDTRKALSIVASEFYGNAHKKLKIIGVTGTNGKTTTTNMIASVLINNGIKCGIIGTLGIYYDNNREEVGLTTPDPLDLHRVFNSMVKKNIEVCVMEVSAHALYFDKVYGIDFEVLVFTNFTQDHLDFFSDMESYKKAKMKLFTEYNYKYIVSNVDDELGNEIAKNCKNVITYGLDNPCDNFAMDLNEKAFGINFILNIFDKIYNVKLNMIGKYNVYNAVASVTCCALLRLDIDNIIKGLESLKGVDGRLECVYSGKFNVFVDYAHTPDGLIKSLTALNNNKKGKLINVFGCGGNRDKSKRAVMGEISGELADFTVITSDNPRFEEPMEIIWEIEKGVLSKTKNYVVVEDRTEAIKYAINYAKENDTILIAGKGSEKYQEVFGIKRYYNDKDTIYDILRG